MNYYYKTVLSSAIIFFITLFLIGIESASADEYKVKSRYHDFQPNDGFMDAGTQQNPYVIEDQYGQEKSTVRPRHHDFQPNDGFMDSGTRQNPYVIEDQYGRETGTIQPRYHDFAPGDGFMERGSRQNPYVIEME
jgi:hypothetical protein